MMGSSRRSRWTKQEDEALIKMMTVVAGRRKSSPNWRAIAQVLDSGKSERQCRERWCKVLNPNLNRDAWTSDEDAILLAKFQEYGKRWAQIADFLPGRTDTAVKNRFSSLQRRDIRMQRAGELNEAAAASPTPSTENSQPSVAVQESVKSSPALPLEQNTCDQPSAAASSSSPRSPMLSKVHNTPLPIPKLPCWQTLTNAGPTDEAKQTNAVALPQPRVEQQVVLPSITELMSFVDTHRQSQPQLHMPSLHHYHHQSIHHHQSMKIQQERATAEAIAEYAAHSMLRRNMGLEYLLKQAVAARLQPR
eukprot:c18009_g1_i3.p1 GENE.c18009_g1_i3~~c18009_g1_i3.p1  ORF type:complete len:321 (+),score=66.46 c18009_g1_i3:47-964(+)